MVPLALETAKTAAKAVISASSPPSPVISLDLKASPRPEPKHSEARTSSLVLYISRCIWNHYLGHEHEGEDTLLLAETVYIDDAMGGHVRLYPANLYNKITFH